MNRRKDWHPDLVPWIVEQSSVPFCILDRDLCIIAMNHLFSSLLGISGPVKPDMPADKFFPDVGPAGFIKEEILSFVQRNKTESVIPFITQTTNSSQKTELILTSFPYDESGTESSAAYSIRIQTSSIHPSPHFGQELFVPIIHEILQFVNHSGYSVRLIQHLLSRSGPILQVPFLSFFEISEQGQEKTAHEISLWSLRYGFLIGEDLNEVPCEETGNLVELLLSDHNSEGQIYTISSAPHILQSVMKQRDVSEIMVFPVIRHDTAGGCLILWGTVSPFPSQIRSFLSILAGIIGEAQIRSRTEVQLSRFEEKFRGVIEDIGDMYYMTDKAGILMEVSPSMATALEYSSPSDLIGTEMETLLRYPEVWPLFLSEVLHENGVKDYELVLVGKRGRIITSSVSCRLIYDDEGFLRGSEGVIRDISRRRQYEQLVQESEWKLEQAQKIAKLGVWSYDNDSRLFRVSSEVFAILNIPPEKSLITLDDLIVMSAAIDKAKFSLYFEQMVKGGNEFGFEFKIELSDEKFKHIRIKGQPRIRSGVVTGSFGIIQDITERKEVEQHLLKYAYQLEQKTLELDAMRTQLLDMNRELDQRVRRRATQIEELLRQKDEFIVQIGHDLKTPLTPLVAILPVIRKRITDPEIGELLDISIEDVQSIKKMITTILELARMNAMYTISDLHDMNLHDALDHIITDNAYLIHQKSLVVHNEIPFDLSVKISPMHLETLMTNLIGNAVKYSYIEGVIRISGYTKGESVVVIIQDQGIGIEPDVLPRIFDTFYKADSSRHDRESHGLGLAIAQRVADIYGGIIRAESQGSGKGATFSVQLKKNPQITSHFPPL